MLRLACFVLLAACGGTGGICAAEEPIAPKGKRYSGRTVDEWHELTKSRPLDALGTPQIVSGLIEIIEDENAGWVDRRTFALTLGRVGAPAKQAIPVLIRILEESAADDQTKLLWSLRGLALFGPLAEDAAPKAAAIARDQGQPFLVKSAAIETLARIGKDREVAVRTLIDLLSTSPASSGDAPDSSSPASEVRDLRLAAAEALQLLGPAATPALPALIRACRDEWPLLRRASATAIGETGPRGDIAIPTLADIILFDEAGEVREAAADSLGKIGERSLPVLAQLLSDDDPQVRQYAIRSLSLAPQQPERNQLLQSALEDESPIVRIQSAAILLREGQAVEPSLNVLLEDLTNADRNARIAAYRQLRTHVVRLRTHRELLERMRDDGSLPSQSRIAAEHLLELLDSGDK